MKFLVVSLGLAALASAIPTPTVNEDVAQIEKRASISDVRCPYIEETQTLLDL